jgi:HEAT repeat protein
MKRFPCQTANWFAVLLAALIVRPALPAVAQDPFAAAPVVGKDKDAEEPEKEEKDEDKKEEEQVDPNDPVLLAIRDSNPTTPDELVSAVETLLRMGAKTQAKEYLQKLIAANPDVPALAALVGKYGSGTFLKFNREAALQPEAGQLAQAAIDAAAKYARDPARIDTFIKDLSGPDDSLRRSAVLDLRQAQDAAINPLLKVLADPARAAEHRYVRWALAQLHKPAIEPLLAALDTSDEALKNQVIEVLGDLKAQRAIMYLVRPYVAPDTDEAQRRVAEDALLKIVGLLPAPRGAERYLLLQARSYLGGAMPLPPDYNGQVQLWRWNPDTKEVVPITLFGEDAARVAAGQAASELYRLRPDNAEYRRLYLTAALSSAKVIAGLDRPLPAGPGTIREIAKNLGAEAVEDVLVFALKDGHFAAAIGAVEVLGDFGDPGLLASTDGNPRPLAEALRHSNRRVRAAAADAIMRIDPTEPYAGSSLLPETLGFLAGTTGLRRALVGHPRPSEAQTVVGMLNDIEFDGEPAFTGRDTFLKAVQSPDYEFLLISDGLDRPTVTELLQMLRRDRRTASLPIGIMARVERLDTLKDQMSFDPLTEVFPIPQDDTSMNFNVRRLLARGGRHLVPTQERLTQAAAALGHLAKLAADGEKYAIYDVLRQQNSVAAALYVPELSLAAAKVLGEIGSPDAQQALVDFASRPTLPIEQRRAAAAAFAAAAEARSVLLTTAAIDRQFERYNASEALPVETQQVLGSILDTIEHPPLKDEQAEAEPEVAAPAGQG